MIDLWFNLTWIKIFTVLKWEQSRSWSRWKELGIQEPLWPKKHLINYYNELHIIYVFMRT